MPGTITFRSACLPENTAPNIASSSSGSRKPKNAAVGLRQNIRRSSRYWRHAAPSHDGWAAAAAGRTASRTWSLIREFQVDVLERRARDAEVLEPLAAGERGGGELVQQ